jgi:hypothetical protein
MTVYIMDRLVNSDVILVIVVILSGSSAIHLL